MKCKYQALQRKTLHQSIKVWKDISVFSVKEILYIVIQNHFAVATRCCNLQAKHTSVKLKDKIWEVLYNDSGRQLDLLLRLLIMCVYMCLHTTCLWCCCSLYDQMVFLAFSSPSLCCVKVDEFGLYSELCNSFF